MEVIYSLLSSIMNMIVLREIANIIFIYRSVSDLALHCKTMYSEGWSRFVGKDILMSLSGQCNVWSIAMHSTIMVVSDIWRS